MPVSGRVTRPVLAGCWTTPPAGLPPSTMPNDSGISPSGVQRLGARFAMPRDAVIERLDTARRALEGSNTVLEAQLTASLARELTHSIPEHRARAGPLSERALVVARAPR